MKKIDHSKIDYSKSGGSSPASRLAHRLEDEQFAKESYEKAFAKWSSTGVEVRAGNLAHLLKNWTRAKEAVALAEKAMGR